MENAVFHRSAALSGAVDFGIRLTLLMCWFVKVDSRVGKGRWEEEEVFDHNLKEKLNFTLLHVSS